MKERVFGTKSVVIVVAVILCVGILATVGIISNRWGEDSSEPNNIDDVIQSFLDIPESGILDVEYDDLDRLVSALSETRYRICGVLVDVDTSYKYWDVAYLVTGENKIHLYLEKNQNLVDGEYVEIVGHTDSSWVGLSMQKCVVTERGASVRERLEK